MKKTSGTKKSNFSNRAREYFSTLSSSNFIFNKSVYSTTYKRIDVLEGGETTIYAGETERVNKNGEPVIEEGKPSDYFSSGPFDKRQSKKLEELGLLKMIEVVNLDYVKDRELVSKTEGWLISMTKSAFGDRCLNKNKIHWFGKSPLDLLEEKAIEGIKAVLIGSGKEVTEEEVNYELTLAKWRVKNMFYKHKKLKLRYLIERGLLKRTNWTIIEACLYQILWNKYNIKKVIKIVKNITQVDLTNELVYNKISLPPRGIDFTNKDVVLTA